MEYVDEDANLWPDEVSQLRPISLAAMKESTPEPEDTTPPRRRPPKYDPGLLVLGLQPSLATVEDYSRSATPESEPEDDTGSSTPQALPSSDHEPVDSVPHTDAAQNPSSPPDVQDDQPDPTSETNTHPIEDDAIMRDFTTAAAMPEVQSDMPAEVETPGSVDSRTASHKSETEDEVELTPLSSANDSAYCSPEQPIQHDEAEQAGDTMNDVLEGLNVEREGPEEGAGLHKCETCEARFKTPYLLKSHRDVHTNDKPHHCQEPKCPRAFKRKSELTRHLKSIHCKQGFKCEHCPDSQHMYPRLDNLNRHIDKAHPEVVRPVTKKRRKSELVAK